MPSLEMFEIAVTHPKSRHVLKFLGQGKSIPEAIKDGAENLKAPYRPDSSGNIKPSIGLGVNGKVNVTLRDGRQVLQSLEEFEEGK